MVRVAPGADRHRKERQHWFGGETVGFCLTALMQAAERIIGYVWCKHGAIGCRVGTLAEQLFTFAVHPLKCVEPKCKPLPILALQGIKYYKRWRFRYNFKGAKREQTGWSVRLWLLNSTLHQFRGYSVNSQFQEGHHCLVVQNRCRWHSSCFSINN